jgi:hypothetical protein
MTLNGFTEDNLGRFLSFVDKPDINGCHPWSKDRRYPKGYGRFWDGWRNWGAHRWFMIYLNGGEDRPGLLVCHQCFWFGAEEDNRWCVAPEHLLWQTPKQNTRDCIDSLNHVSLMRNEDRFNAALDRLDECFDEKSRSLYPAMPITSTET